MYDSKIKQTIKLNDNSWVSIDHLPETLTSYAKDEFDTMFSMHPEKRGNVLVFNKNITNPEWNEIECHRWCQSYENTPQYDKTVMKSYMFSGHNDENIHTPLPDIFLPFYTHMQNMDKMAERYNQVIVNWYENADYIPQHSDCDAEMVPSYTIGMINFSDDHTHTFTLKSKSDNTVYHIDLSFGAIITMSGETQKYFTHGVESVENGNRRISMTFRQY